MLSFWDKGILSRFVGIDCPSALEWRWDLFWMRWFFLLEYVFGWAR